MAPVLLLVSHTRLASRGYTLWTRDNLRHPETQYDSRWLKSPLAHARYASTPSSSLPGSCAKVRSLSQTSANSSLPCPLSLASLAFWKANGHMALIWKANGIRCVSNPKPEAQARIAHLAIRTRYLQAISIGHPASMALLPQNPRCWRCWRQWFSHQYSMTWSTADMVYHPPVCVEIVFSKRTNSVVFFVEHCYRVFITLSWDSAKFIWAAPVLDPCAFHFKPWSSCQLSHDPRKHCEKKAA